MVSGLDVLLAAKAGVALQTVVNHFGTKEGIFTAALDGPIAELMTRNPKRIQRDALASEALAMLKQYRILDLPVVDSEGRPVGMIDAQDLVSLRIVE